MLFDVSLVLSIIRECTAEDIQVFLVLEFDVFFGFRKY